MNNILVLGAGSVVGPFVHYLLDQPDCHVKVASLAFSENVEKLVAGHPRGEAQVLDATDAQSLRALISDAKTDLVADFLPPAYHASVGRLSIEAGIPMVSASFASDEMKALNTEAKDAGILILNEIGLDPGIDHMSAMRIIHKVQSEGGRIVGFSSVCGALPAPEASLNPLGYKFSWHPKGALGAAKRPARYLKEGQEVNIPSDKLFEQYSLQYIEGLGYFELYPNGNSLPYIHTYGIPEIRTMYRGTLRYMGWCETLKKFIELGLLDEKENDLRGLSYRRFLSRFMGSSSESELERNLALHFHIDKDSTMLKRLEWLGLLSDELLPLRQGSAFDVLLAQMMEKLKYEQGERDMVVLQDELVAQYPDQRPEEKITSTLTEYGIPGGDSAVARTVGLPAAIAAKLILQGEINLTGVHIPVSPTIYEPVLEELEQQGIIFNETVNRD